MPLTSHLRMLPSRRLARNALAALACLLLPAVAPSALARQPGSLLHLESGVNRGTLDASPNETAWDFYATPGRFQLVFSSGGPQEAFSAERAPQISLVFLTSTPGAAFTQRTIPGGGTVFSGSVTQRTEVRVVVAPSKGAPAGHAIGYTLVATGSVDFGDGIDRGGAGDAAATAGPRVVGEYAVAGGWTHAGGVVRFMADGHIVTTTGLHGTWSLSDAGSQTYVVTVGPDSRSLIFQPGRGFVDAQNKNLALEARQ